MTHSSDERGAEMRELFFETSQELLQSLNDEALNLEKHPADVETGAQHPAHCPHSQG